MNHDPSIPPVIYQDEHLLLINKPVRLLSVQDGYDRTLPHLRDVLEPLYGRLWMVHRLDKDTSGIILMARDAHTHRILNGSFRERELIKKYHALVIPVPDTGLRWIFNCH